ncbi:hypothetical protein PybrP1_013067 [[Pythium] brassicae (nom. inval.)]|nr:hypothetical protein PybrP1_013067 [[Pythium] brassicae (nom. inval.)]
MSSCCRGWPRSRSSSRYSKPRMSDQQKMAGSWTDCASEQMDILRRQRQEDCARLNSVCLTLLSVDQLEEDDNPADVTSDVLDEADLLKSKVGVLAPGVDVDVAEQLTV